VGSGKLARLRDEDGLARLRDEDGLARLRDEDGLARLRDEDGLKGPLNWQPVQSPFYILHFTFSI